MKILQICNKAPYPPNDGSSIAIYNMCLGLISQNVDLHLFTLNTNKHYKSNDSIPESFRNRTNYVAFDINTNPTFWGALKTLFTKKSYFITRFHHAGFEAKLSAVLRKEKFDIVQLEGLFMCSYIPLIKKICTAKIVLRTHNVEHLIWERYIQQTGSLFKKMYLRFESKKLKKIELEVFSVVDAIVPITPKDSFFIKQFCDTPSHTALTGTNIADYDIKKSADFDNLSLFHFGSMDWIPNQEAVDWFLAKCWKKIKREVPNVKFIIAGRNIPNRYKQLNDPSIVIEENVPKASDVYQKYNIMVVPVLSGSGLRIKIVEGLCFGKAIVSTKIGAEGIDCTPGKDILLATNEDEFSNEVIKLLKDANQRECIAQNARNFAIHHLNNEPIAEKLVAFYKNLIT
ncbi:MAG: glycosyltransferase family 4 protein [Bacteroidetes bacterium]|nr:glycosyltransferase family 4 protein [Bacteroidota bacterium]